MKKLAAIFTATFIGAMAISCQTSLTDIVKTAENPNAQNIASLADKALKDVTAARSQQSNSSQSPQGYISQGNTGGGGVGYTQGVSLYEKVKNKLKPRPFFSDNFESYGIGQTAPFGEWEGNASIKTIVGRNKNITKAVVVQNDKYICLKPKFKNFYLSFYFHGSAWWGVKVKFRKQKNPNVSYVAIADYNKNYFLLKEADNNQFEIARNHFALPKIPWHFFELYADKDRIILYVDYSAAIDITDNDPILQREGQICIYGGDDPAIIDDFVIYETQTMN